MISFECRLERPGFIFDIAFESGAGVTALFGPSGSGKTTTIRLLAGLEKPNAGRIVVDGVTLLDTAADISVPVHCRRIGLVFQDAQLLPHLRVKGNLVYGMRFTPKSERRIDMSTVIDVLGIGHLLDRKVGALSGGEKQRVAIGRALLTSPRLLLMDEPLASLDDARKQEILPFIERMHAEFRVPVVYVSHSVDEVARLATNIIMLDGGAVTRRGATSDVLPKSLRQSDNRPGLTSILTASIKNRLPDYGLTVLAHPAGDMVVPGEPPKNDAARVIVRAEDVSLHLTEPDGSGANSVLKGDVLAVRISEGPFALVDILLVGGEKLMARATRLKIDNFRIGQGTTVFVSIHAATFEERPTTGPDI